MRLRSCLNGNNVYGLEDIFLKKDVFSGFGGEMEESRRKKYVVVGIVILVVAAAIYFLRNTSVLDFNYLEELIESSGPLAPVVFGLFYVLITIFGVSAAWLTILAGTLFGPLEGLVIVVVSATISATLAFYIARYFREKFLSSSKIKDKRGRLREMVRKIESLSENHGFRAVVVLRLSFLPYILLSYAAGLVKNLRARDFILATLITNVFGSFFFIYFGDRLGSVISGDADMVTVLTLVVSVVLLVLFILFVPKVMKRFDGEKGK